jgi:hypothetical protein
VTHILAGEQNAPTLTAAAIDAVAELHSVRSRGRLGTVGAGADARKDGMSVELAQRARALALPTKGTH